MYCKKCGRFIGTDADLCDECKAQEKPMYESAQVTPTYESAQYQFENPYQTPSYGQPPMSAPQNGPAVNLGRAIAAVILAGFGFFFLYCALVAAMDAWEVSAVFMVIGLVPSIMGLVFGAKSISNFKQTAAVGGGKRIPTLILGIDSLVTSAAALFFAFIVFIGLLAMM